MPFEVGRKKTGGRTAGVSNRRTSDFRNRILRSGLTPADFLAQTYRDEAQPINVRVDCAKTLCAYLYPRLTNVDVNSANWQPLVVNVLRFSDPEVEVTRLGQDGALIDGVADAVAPVLAPNEDDETG